MFPDNKLMEKKTTRRKGKQRSRRETTPTRHYPTQHPPHLFFTNTLPHYSNPPNPLIQQTLTRHKAKPPKRILLHRPIRLLHLALAPALPHSIPTHTARQRRPRKLIAKVLGELR